MQILALALLLAPAAAVDLRDWAEFKKHFGKRYATEAEEAQRFEIFLDNLEELEELRKSEGGEVFGVTKFYDRTPEEFRRSHLNYKPIKPTEQIPVLDLSNAPRSTSGSANWVTAGATTDVKDQGYCGSCWAFSAVEQVESAWYLAGNDLTTFSTSQVVQCDSTDAGCNGGDSPTAYSYIKDAGGLASDDAYPYTTSLYDGTTGSCSDNFTVVGGAVASWSYVTPACTSRKCDDQDEDTLQTGLDSAPASICVNAAKWSSYSGGVMTSSACGGNGYYKLDHCVQLTGYNSTASTPYWIVRNSWATDWGEDCGNGLGGCIYLTMGENTCGVADEAMTVSF